MSKRIRLFAASMLLFIHPAGATEIYPSVGFHCVSELGSGIGVDRKSEEYEWTDREFSNRHFLFRFAEDYSAVNHPSFKGGTMGCVYPHVLNHNAVECAGHSSMLLFNKDTLRFVFFRGSQSGYMSGYLPYPKDNRPGNQIVYAGTCKNDA